MSDTPLSDLSRRFLTLGLGMATLTKEKAEEIVNEMIQKGEVKKGEAKQFLSSAKERGKEIRTELQGVVEERVEAALRQVRVAVSSDLQALEKRLAKLEKRIERLDAKAKSEKKSRAAKSGSTKKNKSSRTK